MDTDSDKERKKESTCFTCRFVSAMCFIRTSLTAHASDQEADSFGAEGAK